jgi:PncC family amidohydrolase
VTKDTATLAAEIAVILTQRRQRVAVGESSSGGLISAALLGVPGASAFYLGGSILYTKRAVGLMLDLPTDTAKGMRSSSEPYAEWVAQRMQDRFRSDWAIAETGAAGPDGNGYGDAPGHSCLAIAGPVQRVRTLETGLSDRRQNMMLFADAALSLFLDALLAK